MIELALSAASAFRLGRHAEASTKVIRLVDDLAMWFAANPSRSSAYLVLLDEVLRAQATGDDLRVSDCLEYRLAPALASDFAALETETP